MRSRSDFARAKAASGSSIAISIASAIAPTILGANSASVWEPKISGMPPTLAAIIGMPAAAASITTGHGIAAGGNHQQIAFREAIARLHMPDETDRAGKA